MLLAIDIGNTTTILGIFKNDKLIECWRIASTHTRTIDESWITVKLLFHNSNIKIGEIKGVIISSVVPQLTHIFQLMSKKYLKIEPVIVTNTLNLELKILYKNPSEIGADRLCNAVAGKHLYKPPLIIVDFGTATTFDVLSPEGDYIGGVICPGLETAANDLIRRAARLYKVEYTFPEKIIGDTTTHAMQSGILYGHIAMIDGIIERIKEELKINNFNIISTGGIAEEVSNKSKYIQIVDPDLTLKGLNIIYKLNK